MTVFKNISTVKKEYMQINIIIQVSTISKVSINSIAVYLYF